MEALQNLDDPLILAWDCCNTFVLARITNSLDLEIIQSIVWIEVAYDLWCNLRWCKTKVTYITLLSCRSFCLLIDKMIPPLPSTI